MFSGSLDGTVEGQRYVPVGPWWPVAAARALRMHLIIEGAFASAVESVISGLRKPNRSAQFARRASKSKPQNASSMLPVVADGNRGEKFKGLQNLSTERWKSSRKMRRSAGGVHQKLLKLTLPPVVRVLPSVSRASSA